MSTRPKELWIGMAHVFERRGTDVLNGAAGAYVPALALAFDASDYRELVDAQLHDLGLTLRDIEDVETLADRLNVTAPDQAILELAETVNAENPVVFGTFHAYDEFDAAD